MIQVRVNIQGIQRLRKRLTQNPSLMQKVREAWLLLFRSFSRLRFDRFSKGGGDWPRLAASTLRRRRRGRNAAILRDTGRLFASFNPSLGDQGSIRSLDKPLGVEVFLGGTPLSTIASYHDAGNPPHLPQRELLVMPPQSELDKMAAVAKKIVTDEANQEI
jgi:phage gpG-like protein